MKIIDSIKNSTGPKRKTFPAAVKELAEKDKEGKVVIYEKTGMKSRYLGEVPILDALDIAGDIERALSEEHGGGDYQLSLFKADSELVEKFNYSIAGAPKGRRSGGNKESQKERTSSSEERYYRVLDKLADAAMGGKSSSADEFQRVLLLAKELRGDGGIEKELLVVLMNNLVESKGNDLDTALGILEVSQRLQPQLQREDTFTTLAQTVLPVIGQLIAAKQGGTTGGVQPDMIQTIQQALAQYQGSSLASPATGQPPPPGGSDSRAADPAADPSRLGGSADTAQEPAPEAPTPPLAGSQEYFFFRFVAPFQKDVADGQAEDELAYQIVSMIQYAQDRMPENPPAIIADFLTADTMADHEAALGKFFAAIPELANLTQKQIAIRTVLVMRFMPGAQEPPLEEVGVQDAEPGTIGQTDSAEETGDEDQADITADSTEVEHEAVSTEA